MAVIIQVGALARSQGLTITDLARRATVAYNTAYALYTGRATRIDLATLERIAAALAVEPGDLFVRQLAPAQDGGFVPEAPSQPSPIRPGTAPARPPSPARATSVSRLLDDQAEQLTAEATQRSEQAGDARAVAVAFDAEAEQLQQRANQLHAHAQQSRMEPGVSDSTPPTQGRGTGPFGEAPA